MSGIVNRNSNSTRKFFLYFLIVWGIFLLGSLFDAGSANQTSINPIFLHIYLIFISLIISFILSRDPVGSKDVVRGYRTGASELTGSKEIKGEKKRYSAGYWAFVTIMGLYILLGLIVWMSEGFTLDDLFSFFSSGLVIACALRITYFLFSLIYRRIVGSKATNNRKEEVKSENGKTDEMDSNNKKYGGNQDTPEKIEDREEISRNEGKVDGKNESNLRKGFEGIRLGKIENYWGSTSSKGGFAKVKFNKNIRRGHKIRICGENSVFVQSLKVIKQHGKQINEIASGEIV